MDHITTKTYTEIVALAEAGLLTRRDRIDLLACIDGITQAEARRLLAEART